MKNSLQLEQQAAGQVAALMAAAARTAPKTRGIDNIRVVAVDDHQSKQALLTKMRELAQSEKRPGFERDANCIAGSPVILILGVEANPAKLNCGFCGHDSCDDLKAANGVCSFNTMDLGIATSSAASVAADARVDTRLMFSIGKAALALSLLGPNVPQALGIPLSVTGKSPFFDRKA
jgi:uncharacterized ferredoxin-like protein